MPGRVFISYRSEDKAAADRVCAALEQDGISCWIAPRDIPIAREWASVIVSALESCSHFVLVLSSHSQNAKQISREAELADRQGLPIITLRIEEVEPPPGLLYFLGNLQWLDAFGDSFDSAMPRLSAALRATAGGASPNSPPAAIATTAPATASELRIPAQGPSSVTPEPAAARSAARHWYRIGWIAAAAILVALGIWAWARSRPNSAPNLSPNVSPNTASDVAQFGFSYLQTRDSGDFESAYNLLGPALRSHWNRDTYISDMQKLLSRGKATRYELAGPCTVRERGAYGCEYRVILADGHQGSERLVIANRDGHWAVAGDNASSR